MQRHLVRKVLEPQGFEVIRADQDNDPGAITPRVLSLIQQADLVIADLSSLNPNVFYEVAVAHGFGRPVVHIQRADEQIPFDVKDLRILRYRMDDPDDLETAQERLWEYSNHALEHADELETPLSAAGRFLRIAESGDPVVESQAEVARALDALRAEVLSSIQAPSVSAEEFNALVAPAKRLGVARISEDGVAGDEMKERLVSARSIRILSTSAVRLVEIYKRSLAEALSGGCVIRLLLPHPEGLFVQNVEEVESRRLRQDADIAGQIQTVEAILLDALNEAARMPARWGISTLGTVEIGYFTTHLRSTMVLCDESWGWLTLTLPPLRAAETPSLELNNAGHGSLLLACITHFDDTWNTIQAPDSVKRLAVREVTLE